MCSMVKMRILVPILLLLGSSLVDGDATNAPKVKKIVNKRVHDDIIKRGKNLKLYSCKFKGDSPEGKKKYKCKPVKAVDDLDNSLAGLKLSEKVTRHDVIKLAGIDKFAPWVLDVLKTPPREKSFVNVPVDGTTIPPHPEDLLIDQYAPYDGTSFDNFNYEYEYYEDEELASKEEIIEQATTDVKNIFNFKDKLEHKAKSIQTKAKVVRRSSGEEKDAQHHNGNYYSDYEPVAKQAPEEKAPTQKAAASRSKSYEEKQADLRKRFPEFYAGLASGTGDAIQPSTGILGPQGSDSVDDTEVKQDPYYDNGLQDYFDPGNPTGGEDYQGDEDYEENDEFDYAGQDYHYDENDDSEVPDEDDDSEEPDQGRYDEQEPRGRYGGQQGQGRRNSGQVGQRARFAEPQGLGGLSGGQQGQRGLRNEQQGQRGLNGGQQGQRGRTSGQSVQGGRYGAQSGQGGRYDGQQGQSENANYERKVPNDSRYKDMYTNSGGQQQLSQQQAQQQQQQQQQQQNSYYQDYGSYDYQIGSGGPLSKAQGSQYDAALENSYYSMDPYVTPSPTPLEAKQLPPTPNPYALNAQQPDPYMSYDAYQNPSYQNPQAYQQVTSATPTVGSYTQKPAHETAALLNALFAETGTSAVKSQGIANPYRSTETSYQDPYGDYYAGEYAGYDANTVDPEYEALAQQLAELTSQIKEITNHQTLQQQKQMLELQKQQQDIHQQKMLLVQQQQEIERQRLEIEKQKVLEEQKRQQELLEEKKRQEALAEQQRQQALLQQQEKQRMYQLQQQQQQQYAIAQYSPTVTPSPYQPSVIPLVQAPTRQLQGQTQGVRAAQRMAGGRQLAGQYQGTGVESTGSQGNARPRAAGGLGGRGPRRRFGGVRGQGRPGAPLRQGGPATGGPRGRFMGRRPRLGGRAGGGGRFGPRRHPQAAGGEDSEVEYEDDPEGEDEQEGEGEEGYGSDVKIKYKYVTVHKDGSEVSDDNDYSYDDDSPMIDDEEVIAYNNVIGEDGEVYQELGPVHGAIPRGPLMPRGGRRRGPRMGYPGPRRRRPIIPRFKK